MNNFSVFGAGERASLSDLVMGNQSVDQVTLAASPTLSWQILQILIFFWGGLFTFIG